MIFSHLEINPLPSVPGQVMCLFNCLHVSILYNTPKYLQTDIFFLRLIE